MSLDDVEARLQHDFKGNFGWLLSRNHVRVRLQRLAFYEHPHAVVSFVQKVWQHGNDESAIAAGRKVDNARLLQIVGIRQNCTQVWLSKLQTWVRLDPQS